MEYPEGKEGNDEEDQEESEEKVDDGMSLEGVPPTLQNKENSQQINITDSIRSHKQICCSHATTSPATPPPLLRPCMTMFTLFQLFYGIQNSTSLT